VPGGRRDAVGGHVQPGDDTHPAEPRAGPADGDGHDRAFRAAAVKHDGPAVRDQPFRSSPFRDQPRQDEQGQPLGESLSLPDPVEPLRPLFRLGSG
jgi:hypothetical protein